MLKSSAKFATSAKTSETALMAINLNMSCQPRSLRYKCWNSMRNVDHELQRNLTIADPQHHFHAPLIVLWEIQRASGKPGRKC